MEPKEKKAFEPSGLVPRSIVRTFERFRQQLLPGSETAAIREYRISRYQVLVSARCLFTLLIIPIATNWLVSSWLLSPLVEHFWNTQQNEIFLNSYQEERAFAELESFSEKLFFESLLNTTNTINVDFTPCKSSIYPLQGERSWQIEDLHGVSNSGDRNLIPLEGKCYGKNFSSSSQSSATNKLIPPTRYAPVRAFFEGVTGDKGSVAELRLPQKGMRSQEQDKSSICKICVRNQAINDVVIKSVPINDYVNSLQILLTPEGYIEDLYHLYPLQAVPAFYNSSICAARVNSPFNKRSKAWYSSIFHPRETSKELAPLKWTPSCAFEESPVRVWGMRERNFLLSPLPCKGMGYSEDLQGVEFIQYEKYLPLPSWENKEDIISYDSSLTQRVDTIPSEFLSRIPHTLTGLSSNAQLGVHFSGASSSHAYPIPLQGFLRTRSWGSILVELVPSKFHANGISQREILFAYPFTLTGYGVRGQQLRNSLQAIKVNNGVKAWGTEAKDPFLLSVPIESTYDHSLKIKEKVQNKILELAIYYNQQTIISITNIVGDVVSLVTLGCLFIWMKPEITILKSFLIEAIYSLSDTTKSFLLILLTDLLVGFHSPRGWETALELLLKHFGLPENQDFVFLFVATFPVLLDTVFKYWIFRHLNKISPSTVATYHSMIE